MEYLVEGKKFHYSYAEVREQYLNFCAMKDADFKLKLPSALHLACFICYLKEIPTYVCLSDEGIIHQLVHLMDISDCPLVQLKQVRKLFKRQLELK